MTGPPFFICSLNLGITDPDEFNTLPNLTIDILILLEEDDSHIMTENKFHKIFC